MRNYISLSLFFLSISAPVSAQVVDGKLIKTIDGEFYIVKINNKDTKVRLRGITIPKEFEGVRKQTIEYVESHDLNEDVKIDIKGADKSGLKYVDIKMPWGDNLAETLLREGLCIWDKKNAPNMQNLQKSELEGKYSKKGIWFKEEIETTTSVYSGTQKKEVTNNNEQRLPPDAQFELDISNAVYQHSLAESNLTRARTFGGREDRLNASLRLAMSLDYDIKALEKRIISGNMIFSRLNLFRAEVIRIKSERNRQTEMSKRDDLDYRVGLASYDTIISKIRSGINVDKETEQAENIFKKIEYNNIEAVKAIHDAESRLQKLISK